MQANEAEAEDMFKAVTNESKTSECVCDNNK